MKQALSVVLALGAWTASASAQSAVGTFIADPENGRILRYTMSGGPGTVVVASGPPLVEPVSFGRGASPLWGITVCDRGAGAVFLMNEVTGAIESTVVQPGAGGLVAPVAATPKPRRDSHLLVLDGHDGTVREYVASTGEFVGVLNEGRGPATGMMLGDEQAPPPIHWREYVFIAYADPAAVVRFNAETGEMLNTVLSNAQSRWLLGNDHSRLVLEDRINPTLADRVYLVEGNGLAGFFFDLPVGLTPRGIASTWDHIAVSSSNVITLFEYHSPSSVTLLPLSAGHSATAMRWSTCYAECDTGTGPSVLDIFDFLCFSQRFSQGDPYACNCDTTTGVGVCDIWDFLCFNNWFAYQCP